MISTTSATDRPVAKTKTRAWTPARKRRLLKVVATIFMLVYAAITLFPFYVLFIRTFVSTKESVNLHLWIPPQEDISLDAEVGNLSVNFNLDLKKVKEDLGIKGYVNPRDTLRKVAVKNNIPTERMQQYFAGFGTFNGWITLLGNPAFWQSLLRTAMITVASIALLCFLSILTGAGIARLRRRYQMAVYNLYLLQMVIPAIMIIIPQFLMVQGLENLIPGADKPGSTRNLVQILFLIMIFIKGGALSTMVFTTAINQVPGELEESAYLDGASRWQTIWRILFPLMRVPIATVSVIMLPVFWNAFIEPFVYLDTANTTMLPLIANYSGAYAVNYQIIYTGVFVSVIPLLLVYLLLRKLFIRSVMAGAIKG
jgi:ABC-type glycerol-3-phosphate transport system permease component